MITLPNRAVKKPKIESLSYREWTEGTVTSRDDGRTPVKGLRATGNVQLTQDGTIGPRPSLLPYGTALPGTLLGDMFEFVQTTGTTKVNWIGALFNVSGTVKFYICKDGGTWQVCNGKTFNVNGSGEFFQIEDKVGICTSLDHFAYFDVNTAGLTNTVVPTVALTDPSAPTLGATTNLVGTNHKYWYAITKNSTVGQTAVSAYLEVNVKDQRETWVPDGATPQSVTINWTADASAASYNVYMSTVNPSTGALGKLIASGVSGTTFTDNGSAQTLVSVTAPVVNTTAGPKAIRGTVINGQVFLIDAEDLHLVRAGGTSAGSLLDFSPFGGGGDIPIGRGTKEFPVAIKLVQSGQGSKITVFCRGTNGYGKRYVIKPDTLTSGDDVIAFYGVEEDNGEDGTDSPHGVVMYKDDAWYPSRDGFKKTGVKPSLQTMLKTDTISETIEKDVKNLSSQYMDKCVGLAYQGQIYWALPVGSSTNNEIWVLNTKDGAWMKPWNISATTMTLYNDNMGNSHFLIVSNNVLYELTESQATMDGSIPVRTNITSGFIKFSENGQDWAKVIDVTFVVQRPQGQLNFTVSGRLKGGNSLASVGNKSFTSSSTVAGWGEAGWGGAPSAIYGWSNFDVVPVAYADASRNVTIKVNKLCKWITWELNTSTSGVNYQLTDVIIRYVKVGYIKES